VQSGELSGIAGTVGGNCYAAQLLTQAVEKDWDVGRLRVELAAQQERSRA
jgi:hypothetical protein